MRLDLSKEEFFLRGGVLDKVLDSTFERSLIIDKDGRVIFFSKNSQLASGKSKESVLGLHINDVYPSEGLLKVLETGESDEGLMTLLDDQMGIATHIPVFDKDELIGVIGIVYFNSIASIKKVLAQMPMKEDKVFDEVYHSISRQFSTYSFKDYVGKSDVVKKLIEKTKNAAESNYPVLLIGETGTGKEILANAIHNYNRQTFTNPFVKINCSAIPSELLESELFGHEKGAFTGAGSQKRGKFEVANNGSILLDEIGDMSFNMQTKLLRVLEEKEFERVGGNRLIATNARVIASTNVDLKELSAQKRFREDLYYRLNILEIRVPSLRERIEDIPYLVEHFVKKNHLSIVFSKEALDYMMTYSWPGNVRQLRNVVNRFGVLNKNSEVRLENVYEVLPRADAGQTQLCPQIANAEKSEPDKIVTLEAAEKELIIKALKICNGNKSKAASMLAVSRSTLNRKVSRYELDE